MIDPFIQVKLYDERVLKVKGLIPTKTSWGRVDGRPIYDRLPSGAETYQVQSPDDVLVLLTGSPNNLEVGAWERSSSILVIRPGILTWEHGQVPIETYAVNLSALDLQDGDYQVGYYLDYEEIESPPELLLNLERQSLSESLCLYESSKPDINKLFRNFVSGTRWTSSEGKPEWFAIDLTEPLSPTEFRLQNQLNNFRVSSYYSLYSSNDAILWELETRGTVTNGFSDIPVPRKISRRYWKIYLWGGEVDLISLSYTGQAIFPNTRPNGKVSTPTPFVDNKFAELEKPGIVLAFITVQDNKIVETIDTRRTTTFSYEPVAKWLTSFQDENLKRLFDYVVNYSDDFLSPTASFNSLYRELLSEPGFRLDSYKNEKKFIFPSRTKLDPPRNVIVDAELLSSSISVILTEGSNLPIVAENVPLEITDSKVKTHRIIRLSDPLDDDHICTKGFVETELDIPVNNGTYD